MSIYIWNNTRCTCRWGDVGVNCFQKFQFTTKSRGWWHFLWNCSTNTGFSMLAFTSHKSVRPFMVTYSPIEITMYGMVSTWMCGPHLVVYNPYIYIYIYISHISSRKSGLIHCSNWGWTNPFTKWGPQPYVIVHVSVLEGTNCIHHFPYSWINLGRARQYVTFCNHWGCSNLASKTFFLVGLVPKIGNANIQGVPCLSWIERLG